MTDSEKQIAALEKEIATLKKQLAQAVRGMAAMEKKLNRVYHGHNALSNQVAAVANNQRNQRDR